MVAANADNSMGVAVEVPVVVANAVEEDISDIEIDYNYQPHFQHIYKIKSKSTIISEKT